MILTIRDKNTTNVPKPPPEQEVELFLDTTYDGSIHLRALVKGDTYAWNLLKIRTNGRLEPISGIPAKVGFEVNSIGEVIVNR